MSFNSTFTLFNLIKNFNEKKLHLYRVFDIKIVNTSIEIEL